MMKVNELRIGNWVTLVNKDIFKNIDYQIDAFDIYKASEFPDLSEAMLPIPLNEEWLLKFRYTREDIPNWIEFVHDLQNWYYYNNKKKELTLKP
jgi:hypothetical protein